MLADTSYFDVRSDNAAESVHSVGDTKGVELDTLKVSHQPAPDADVVVVMLEVSVEPHAFAARAKRGDEPEVIEQPKCPVDCVKRYRRHPLLDRSKYGLRIGMIQACSDLAKDLEALMC